MSGSASLSSSNKYQRSVPSLQLSQRGAHFFAKFRDGTCMYGKQQQEKPLSVTDIFRQQSELMSELQYTAGKFLNIILSYFP